MAMTIPRRMLCGAGEQKGSESCALKVLGSRATVKPVSIDGKPQQNRTKTVLYG